MATTPTSAVKEPALGRHARTYYELLAEQAKPQIIDGEEVLVFEGKLIPLFEQLGISKSYYSRLKQLLIESGSIEQLRRGTKGSLSVVHLRGLPPAGAMVEAIAGLTPATGTDTLLGYIEALAIEVASLTAWRESITKGDLNIAEALRNHELRITKLEKKRVQSGK